jgi:hypothetical protein
MYLHSSNSLSITVLNASNGCAPLIFSGSEIIVAIKLLQNLEYKNPNEVAKGKSALT